MADNRIPKKTDTTSIGDITFNKLRRLYLLALTLIALSAIGSQLLIQYYLQHQLGDAKVINIAGRQRMLSQKLTKEILLLTNDFNSTDHRKELKNTLEQWTLAHEGLQNRSDSLELSGQNSPLVKELYIQIAPYYQNLQALSDKILVVDSLPFPDKNTYKNEVLQNEKSFLKGMDSLVFAYEQEAKSRVKNLRFIEYILFAVLMGLLILELLFIFRPTAKRTQQLVQELSDAGQESAEIAEENKLLVKEKEKSLKALQTLNYALDNAALYASLTLDGKLLYISEKFKTLLGITQISGKANFIQLATSDEGEQQYLNELIHIPRSTIWTQEIQLTKKNQEKIWLEITIIPINQEGIQQDLLLLCTDLTLRKNAQLEVERLNKERFEMEMEQQKIRSIQVVQAQDEERKRIAKDMHDGIGQMLTALKFNLEAINLKKPEKAAQKLADVRLLAGDVIKSVRVATFNLTPPELGDYGINTGIAKLVEGLQVRTGKNILFENRTNFNNRLELHIETNLYRITQEALNNAIKYAQANYILVTLSHSNTLLSIVVDDDGIGFNKAEFAKNQPPKKDGSGMGLGFMQERVNFINGRLFIRSTEGEGTRITVNMPFLEAR